MRTWWRANRTRRAMASPAAIRAISEASSATAPMQRAHVVCRSDPDKGSFAGESRWGSAAQALAWRRREPRLHRAPARIPGLRAPAGTPGRGRQPATDVVAPRDGVAQWLARGASALDKRGRRCLVAMASAARKDHLPADVHARLSWRQVMD